MFEIVKAEIITTGANLRKGPGSNYGIVDQLAKEDIVEVLSHWVDPTWVKIKVLKTRTGIGVGEVGYIWSSELRLLPPEIMPEPAPLPAPTPEPRPLPPINPREDRDVTRNLIRGAISVAAVVAAALVIMWLLPLR